MFKEPNLVNGCFFRMFLFLFFDNYYRLLYLSDLIWLVSYLGSLFNLRLSSIVGGVLVGGGIVFSSAFRFLFYGLPWVSFALALLKGGPS